MTKKQEEKYQWTAKYVIGELKTGRHLTACLGSAGLTFGDDIERFSRWCEENGYWKTIDELSDKIN